jgi:predicted PurR-regulated permease PerM
MENYFKMPLYAKVALISICILAVGFIMCIGQHIIIPVLYAALIAVLLNPLVNFLVRKRMNRIVSIAIVVVLAFFLTLTVIYIISSQVTLFSETYPQLKEKFNVVSKEMVHWISEKFKIQESKINTKIRETGSEAIRNFEIGEQLTAAGRILMVGTLLPVYLFMILYYKPLFLEFIRKLFRAEHHTTVTEVLTSTKLIIHSYLVGLFFEMLIVAVLNSVGLLLLGINYAILLGVIGAVVNIIPYIGGIIATALPMIIAFVTKDSAASPFFVMIVYIIIQFVDNHYLVPNIVASRVKINAFVSILVVLMGGAIWGIPGMFLSIPLTAIIKVIFDHIEPLKPWGFLLGNLVPAESKFPFKNLRSKA